MKPSHDRWTIVLFRGATRNPLRISLRKATVKRVLLAAVILSVMQMGVLALYVMQTSQVTNQVAELEELKEELSQSKGQVVEFSDAVDKMRQRVLTIQSINKKLQVMFGLEPEQGDTAVVNGQGGEEAPLDGRTGILNFDYLAEIGEGENPDDPGIMMATDSIH